MPKYPMYILLLLANLREFGGTLLRASRAENDEFPWLIQFHTISPCGGVLISPDWVLTAAQCVQSQRNSIILYATGLNGTNTSQAVSVKATYIHPQYQGYSANRDYDNNIALLKLVKSFDMCDEKVRLLDIAPIKLDDDYKTCIIFGWQSTLTPTSKVLAKPIHYSHVLLNSWRVCMYMHRGNASYRNVFCTVIDDGNGVRACAGNPGSPVVCEDRYNRMVLIGIASWSNFSLDCGGLPTYLGVNVFRSWMWDLIYGSNKNSMGWEIDDEAARGAAGCRRHENRPVSRGENHRGKKRNYTRANWQTLSDADYDDFRDNSYDPSWRAYDDKTAGSEVRMRISALTRIPEVAGKLEPPVFERIYDYTRVSDVDAARKNYNVARFRDEQLSQYREIGRDDNDHLRDNDDEPVAVPSQRDDKVSRVNDKPMKIHSGRENDEKTTENFDVLELVMPEGIEDFDHSASADLSHCKYFPIFFHQLYLLL